VTDNKPDQSDDRVVPLRPGMRIRRDAGTPPEEPVEDLGKYERTDDADDYRHRMLVNAAALVAVVLLAAAGIWIADRMAEVRKTQDCVLSGRRNCAAIPAPTETR
jgi:hypothetical protein